MFNGIFDNEDVRQNVSGKKKFTHILHVLKIKFTNNFNFPAKNNLKIEF